MSGRNIFQKVIENRKAFALKRASLLKYAELDQLFRAMLGLFELWMVLDYSHNHGGRGLLIGSLSVYLGMTVAVMVLQNFWPALREFNNFGAIMTDTVFFSLFLLLGADASHVFLLNFLFVPYCIGLRIGSGPGAPYILLNLFAFVGVNLFEIYSREGLKLGYAAAWTAFVAGFGHFLAVWGNGIGREIEKQRLLRRIREFMYPGVGLHVASDYILTELREFLDVESCSALFYIDNDDQMARTVMLVDGKPFVDVAQVPQASLEVLRRLDDDCSFIYTRKNGKLESFLAFHHREWKEVDPPEGHEHLAEGDEDLTFLTVPLRGPREVYGRAYVRGSKRRQLTFDDMRFVWKVVEMVSIYLENLRLAEKIAEDAAEIERQRIALDIHDTVVQPYVAVQMGISSLRRKIESRVGVMVEDVNRLDSLVQLGITDLRDYVRGLKNGNGNGNGHGPKKTLFASVERYAAKFGEATGVMVVFHHDEFGPGDINGRLSADIFQMICEGVSNARKHTRSRKIIVELRKTESGIVLSVEDEGDNKDYFLPRSISQRAGLHGGNVKVIPATAGGVRIRVEIPTVRKL